MENVLNQVRFFMLRIVRLPLRVMLPSVALIVVLLLGVSMWYVFIAPPSDFPSDTLIEVKEGLAVSVLADELESKNVIRSSFSFHIWMRLTGADRSVHAGTYYFARPLTMFTIARRIEAGERGVESIRVTLTEGMTAREMGETLEEALPDFAADTFTELAKPFEGYLFPDTYFIDPGTTPEVVVELLQSTFEEKTDELRAAAGSSFDDAVILASLIEKEADTAEDRRIVSGILWNRLEIGMPLQVDAVFGYILGRSGYAPNGDDLEIDSPYNTYTNPGLPPGPIANPGLDAIAAAINPAETEYFYYLTGRDGLMYYAETFDAHKENRELYLD